MKNLIIAQIKESIRHAQTYTPLTFMKDGGVVCPKCTKDNFKVIVQDTISQDRSGWEAFGMQPHWEGAPLTCDNCNCQIESEYGDPFTEESDPVIVGGEYYWNDPDAGACSSLVKVIEIKGEIILVDHGTSTAEVFAHELEKN